jgi:hypothetical protein
MPRQLITDNFAILLVIFDDKDVDGIRLALLRMARQPGGEKTPQPLIFTQRGTVSSSPKSSVTRNLPS